VAGIRLLTIFVRVDDRSQVSLGEMVSYLPIPGGHIKLAERFVNGAFSFVRDFVTWSRLNINILQTMGWNYWYNWTIVLPAELSAAAVLIDFWDKNTNVNSAWVTICLAVVVAINFMGAGKSCETPTPRKRHN
jgi:yeast amino acid transporter